MYQLKRRRLSALVLVAVLAVLVVTDVGSAQAQTSAPMSKAPNSPLIAVVSLSSQRVTIYSARGKMLESPVSTGKSGYETPAGIYSILQKRRYHYSNLYNDASMPFMQRITWSGIALHAGELPGYPASHGCIRLPYGFASQLFELTKRGMRVVVVRNDVSPVEFAHRSLFRPAPLAPNEESTSGNLYLSSAQGDAQLQTAVTTPRLTRRSIVAAREVAAEAAAKKAEEMRRIASRLERDAAAVVDALYEAESAKKRAAARIEEADILSSTASLAEELKAIKIKAQERLAAAQVQIDAIYAKDKEKIDAVRAAWGDVKAADAAKLAAQNEAVSSVGRPVSVFISRKTQRVYVRRAFQPLFEAPVTIQNPKAPIGTIVFTAMNWSDDDAELSWTALSMYPHRSSGSHRHGEPPQTSPDAARAALERVSIPQDAIERISQLISPGSSLIISDEGLSKETGDSTDFVVLMSGESQGGIARRRPANPVVARYNGLFSPGGSFNFFNWQ